MSFSKKQIIDRAFRIANLAGVEGHSSPVIDNKVVAEDLFPLALRKAVLIGSGIENEVNSLKREYEISVIDGVASLPDTVLEECLDSSSLSIDGGDSSDLISYEPRFIDYLRNSTQYQQLSYFTAKGNQFYFTESGENVGESDAAVTLTAVGLPDVADLTTAITISTNTAERTIELLARMIRGMEV